ASRCRFRLRLRAMRADQVAARRMRNSRLTGPRFTRPDAVAAWHGAMQGQDYGQAKWSIGQRAGSLVDADVDQALAAGSIVLMHCELEAVICSGGLRGKQHTFALLDKRVPPDRGGFDRDVALVELTRRYLASHGPATTLDLGWWSSLTIAEIDRALHSLGDEVRGETIDGLTFWMAAGEPGRAPSRSEERRVGKGGGGRGRQWY